jgi:hypothetical protein
VRGDYCNITMPLGSAICESPPGLTGPSLQSECYKCGLPVCRACSSLIVYYGRRCRICAACQEELRGDAARKGKTR